MAFILCPKHGGNPAAFVCHHIRDRVQQSAPSGDSTCVQAEYEGEIVRSIQLCRRCADQLGYSDALVIRYGEAGFEEVLSINDQYPICPLCLSACRQADGN